MAEKGKSNSGRISNGAIIGIVAGAIFLIILIAILVISGMTGTGNVVNSDNYQTQNNPSTTIQNCHDVQVPYEETYSETIPYTGQKCDNINLQYTKSFSVCQSRDSGFLGIGSQQAVVTCKITNLDTVGGSFGAIVGFMINGQENTEQQSQYIYPQQSYEFTYSLDSETSNCICREQIPTKQVCRDVTLYRDVEKTRTVYRTETQCN